MSKAPVSKTGDSRVPVHGLADTLTDRALRPAPPSCSPTSTRTLRTATDQLTSAVSGPVDVICDVADEAQVAAMVERTVATEPRCAAS